MLGVLLANGCIVTVNAAHGDAGLAATSSDLRVPRWSRSGVDWQRPGSSRRRRGARASRYGTIRRGCDTVAGLERPGPGPFRDEPDGIAVEMLPAAPPAHPSESRCRTSLSSTRSMRREAHYGSGQASGAHDCDRVSRSSAHRWCTCLVCSAPCSIFAKAARSRCSSDFG